MKKKYRVVFWEKEEVWARITAEVESDVVPTKENMADILKKNSVNYLDSECDFGTANHLDYDFENDFVREETK